MSMPNTAKGSIPGTSGASLIAEGLACRRGGRLLFAALDLRLRGGEAALVRGPNGVGKSSLLRMIAGLLPPFAGRLDVGGAVSLADDRLALDADRTLRAALDFWARLDGADREQVADALGALDLAHLAPVPVRILSTGQRKRAALARTMVSRAPIWLLDEPANGLDDASIDRLGTVVGRHLAGGGLVVAASHQTLPWVARHDITLGPPMATAEPTADPW